MSGFHTPLNSELPDAYFGSTTAPRVDWRKTLDVDPDDEELGETPPDVVAMLGFDPADAVLALDELLEEALEALAMDDASWNPDDHPQAPAGSAKGGQFVKKGNVPLASSSTFKQFEKHIRNIHGIANSEGLSVEEKIKLVQNYVDGMKSYKLKDYTGKVISHLMKEGWKKEAKTSSEPTSQPPTSSKPEEAQKPELSGGPSKEEDKKDPENVGSKSVLNYLDFTNAPTPHKDSVGQKDIYKAAEKQWSLITQGKEPPSATGIGLAIAEVAHHVPPGGFASKYADEWYKFLQLTPNQISLVKTAAANAWKVKFEEATKTTKPTEPTKPTGVTTSPRPQAKKHLERLAAAHANDAYKASSTGSMDFWNKVPTAQRKALTSYTGSGFNSINSALRDPNKATPDVVNLINHIDEVFDHPDAALKDDVVVKRFFSMPKDQIDKIQKSLALGMPTRFDQSGFISTSVNKKWSWSGSVSFTAVVKKGTPALFLKPISNYSSEGELLLRHGQAFEVLEMKKSEDGHTHFTLISV